MHKRRGQMTSEEIEVMFVDRMAFGKEGRGTGESRNANIVLIKMKRRIDHNVCLMCLKCAI